MGENIFVLLKSEQKFTCEQKAASAPWDGLEIFVAVTCGCVLQPHCAVLSPPLQGRAVPGIRRSPVHFFEGPGLSLSPSTADIYGGHCLAPKVPSQPCPFHQQKSSSWLGTGERDPGSLVPQEECENCLFPYPTLQNFSSNALPFFLTLSFFPFLFTPFLPAFHSCLFSFSCWCYCFSLSPPLLLIPTVFLSHLSFYLHIFPLFLSQLFCFCSLIISFLPVLSSVSHSHPSTLSLPLIILLFFAAVSFNAFFDTAYSLMIIWRSGDAGAMNFTNPALRASVHNHSSRSTGAES